GEVDCRLYRPTVESLQQGPLSGGPFAFGEEHRRGTPGMAVRSLFRLSTPSGPRARRSLPGGRENSGPSDGISRRNRSQRISNVATVLQAKVAREVRAISVRRRLPSSAPSR